MAEENGNKVHALRNGGHSKPLTNEARGRGGWRPGSGRKPNYLKRLGIKALTAAEILAHHDEPKLWYGLLHHKSADIRLRTLSYLTDRRDGKAKQAVDVSGAILHAHATYRNPQLAALSLEELQALDNITKKLTLPAPDGPHNQTKSDAATNAIDVECETIETVQAPQTPLIAKSTKVEDDELTAQ